MTDEQIDAVWERLWTATYPVFETRREPGFTTRLMAAVKAELAAVLREVQDAETRSSFQAGVMAGRSWDAHLLSGAGADHLAVMLLAQPMPEPPGSLPAPEAP